MESHDTEKEPRLIVKSGSAPDRDRPLYSSALSVDDTIGHLDYTAALQQEGREDSAEPLSVYVHLPFCPSRCLTCDHQTSVSHDSREIDRYLDAMEREVQLVTDNLGTRRRLQQLHLGGGTPNYLSEVQLVRLVDILDRCFVLDEHTETSLEANAHRASLAQLSLLHGLGFRGLNLEIRDLDPQVQEVLGRHQSLRVIRDVVENARDIGFETVTTDLVYGLPRQSGKSIRNTVKQLLSLAPDRVNCFRHSRRAQVFEHQHAIDQSLLPSLADKVAIFSHIVDGFCEAGYQWLGLDCFALPADGISLAHARGALRRNWIGYTEQSGRRLVGFGSSSVSDLPTLRARNHSGVNRWRDCLERGELPICSGEAVSPRARARRHALSDLMCNLEISEVPQTFRDGDELDPTLQALQDDGLVEVYENRIAVTETGRFALHQMWGDSSPSYRWAHLA